MKVCLEQFLAQNHSWSIVGQNIARCLLKQGHDVHLKSTNGYDHFPNDLKSAIRETLDKDYDMQLSYTAMRNFPVYLSHGSKNRFGIWNYETTVLPFGFTKYHKFTDKFLPSSNFSKQIFSQNGVPEDKMVVVPHGADTSAFQTKDKYPLKTRKRLKILANIAQPHIRKNIPGLLESYGQAFNSSDDVCLVAKISVKSQKEMQFDVDFNHILKSFQRKFPKHGEIELITHFIPNIAELYNSCDVVFSTTHAECFWLPGIESMAAGKVTVAPNYGGQLDFMNESNSLLIKGKIIASPRAMQYWTTSPYAAMFEPDVEDAARLLRACYDNYDQLLVKFAPGMKDTVQKYTWDNVVNQILQLCI